MLFSWLREGERRKSSFEAISLDTGFRRYDKLCVVALIALLIPFSALASQVFTEDMTWQEITSAVKGGSTTIIIPTGGTEQNGPHMVTGKHNYILKYTSGRIAEKLGNALTAPVLAYVPEGNISPPEGHMRFPGTISLSQQTFEAVLEDSARSFRQHGFKLICFLGEHGASQKPQEAVAERLSKEWQSDGVKVISVSDYYSEKNGQEKFLQSEGHGKDEFGVHASLPDTSELMYVYARGVRNSLLKQNGGGKPEETGVNGDPIEASGALGKKLLDLKIDAAVKQIKGAMK